MKKVIRLTESDLVRIVKIVISESDYSISDLEQYKYKRETRSIDEIIEDNFNEFITDIQLNPKAFKSFGDFCHQVVVGLIVRPTLYKFDFKGNKTKEREYKELLANYIIKKYKKRLKEYFTK